MIKDYLLDLFENIFQGLIPLTGIWKMTIDEMDRK